VPVGRRLDRHGGRALMTGGSVVATLLVVAWSQVRTVPQLYLVWTALGVVSAAVLYDAAFAVLVAWFPAEGRATAILAVTVVAGFASSIFLPLTGALVEGLGWRAALLVLAAVHGATTIPLHLLVPNPPARRPPEHGPVARPGRVAPDAAVRDVLRDPAYLLLGAVFVVQAAAVSIVSVHLVAVLRDLGHSARFAADAAGLLGLLSVTGRLVTTAAGRRRQPEHVTAAVFAVQAVGALTLVLVGQADVGAVVGVIVFGLGFGVATIARPLLLAQRYGTARYATIAGTLAVPLTAAKATAPLAAGAVRAAAGDYRAVGVLVAVGCLLASVGCVLLGRDRPAG